MASTDPDTTLRANAAQSSADSIRTPDPKPSVYASLPAALRPPALGCPDATYEELATVAPMKDFPLAMLPATNQRYSICLENDAIKSLSILTDSGYLSTIAQAQVNIFLTDECGHAMQLLTVANHPDKHGMSFGNNYEFAIIKRTLKAKHILTGDTPSYLNRGMQISAG
ncbi:hypothetical protein EWM64_g1619 [Hericium alpestre]|uniref:Uncharacterized protein n=1 Tax=Hericium alpestre TaxID=135208 RepID=A0A4Z0A5R6_9AGAM|nr:hypothetical protein EWM64_g1619 [Hericium alpestre]